MSIELPLHPFALHLSFLISAYSIMAFSNKQQINSMENLIQSLTDTKQDILNSDSEITVKSLNVSNVVVAGNITCPLFKITNAAINVSNIFPSTSSNTLVTIANNITCFGRTLIFYVSVGGYATSANTKRIQVRFKDSGGTIRANVDCKFNFNQTGVHQAWSKTDSFTGITAGTYRVDLFREGTSIKSDQNDLITVVIEELPY